MQSRKETQRYDHRETSHQLKVMICNGSHNEEPGKEVMYNKNPPSKWGHFSKVQCGSRTI